MLGQVIRGIVLVLGLCALTACATSDTARFSPDAAQAEVAALAAAIEGLGPGVDPFEAQDIAQRALSFALEQRALYRVSAPPIIHNMKINAGLRERGLCYHWADDLNAHLSQQGYESVIFQRAIANHTNPIPWDIEHSSLIVTRPGASIARGIVLDGWRNGGDLYWGVAEEDPEYAWVEFHLALAERRAYRETRFSFF